MKVEPINPPDLEEPRSLSQGTRTGDWVFVSGQGSLDRDGWTIGAGDFPAQVEHALERVARVLSHAGANLSQVVRLTAYLVSPLHIGPFHDICARIFSTNSPTATTVAVSSLGSPDALVEIEACAHIGTQITSQIQRKGTSHGPFANAIRAGNTIFISGQTATSDDNQPLPTDFPSQLHAVYRNLDASLSEFGAGFSDLVKIDYFISNPLYYRELFRIREEVFDVDWPGDSVVSVRALDSPHALVEANAVALVPPAKAQFVNPAELPSPFNFSHIVVADGLAYVSGQIAMDKDKNLVLPGDFDAQFRQSLKNVETALDSVGCSFADTLKLSCFISHPVYFERSLEIREEVFQGRPPAITSVAVDSMGGFPAALCEIDAIAAVP